MSVINQMLKDLDERKAATEFAQPQAQPIFAVRHRSSLWLLIGLAGSAFALVLWWFWFGNSSQPVPPASQVLQVEAPQAALQLVPVEETNTLQPDGLDTNQPLEAKRLYTEPVQPDAISTQSLTTEPSLAAKAELQLLETSQPALSKKVNDAITEQVQSELRVERVELSDAEKQQYLRQQARQAEYAGRTTEARTYWQQFQALAPQQAEPYMALARMAQQAGYEAGSQYWLQLGLEQGADVSQLAVLLAASYARQQQWSQVLQVLELLPETGLRPPELAMRAAAWQQLGQHQAALAAFDYLNQLEPQQGRWWLGMAISSDALGQRQQAVTQFQRSLQLGDDLTVVSKDYIRQRLQELN